MKLLQDYIRRNSIELEFKHIHIGTWDEFSEQVNNQIDDYEFQGEEGLMKAFEIYEEEWECEEVYVDRTMKYKVYVWMR